MLSFPMAWLESKMKYIYLDFKVTLNICSKKEKVDHITDF